MRVFCKVVSQLILVQIIIKKKFQHLLKIIVNAVDSYHHKVKKHALLSMRHVTQLYVFIKRTQIQSPSAGSQLEAYLSVEAGQVVSILKFSFYWFTEL